MKKKFYMQALFWITIVVIHLAFLQSERHPEETLIFDLISILLYAFAFYLNLLWLFPRFYDKSKTFYWAGSMVLLIAIFLIIQGVGMLVFGHEGPRHHRPFLYYFALFRQAFWLVLIFMIGTVYSIQKMLNHQISRNKEVIEEKLQTELQLLKAQINPHFLFNALNNIYALTYMKSEKAPDGVLKLSEMLRYVLEDCSQEMVPLRQEIAYIENFMDFYRMKNPGKRNMEFEHETDNADIHIAPMLFIPFIENSFKYSRIEEDKNGFVRLRLQVIQGKLTFDIRNSVFAGRTILPGSGRGIANVRQRLDILYPGKYELTLEDGGEYHVVLNMTLT
jgi:two-component system, LytTR family, sensor kinase